MNEDSAVLKKSLAFAVRITKLAVFLQKSLGYAFIPVIQQILKSGTSIGANVREAEYAESKDDFVHKLKIALKELTKQNSGLWFFIRVDTLSKKVSIVYCLTVKSC